MTKEVIAMAREAGFSVKNFKPPVVTAQHSNGSWVSVGDELEKFATLVGNAKLEEAAKKCEALAVTACHDSNITRHECAQAIRAMKDPTT